MIHKNHINNFEKFKKDKFIIERRLDLHEQTLDQAYNNLKDFIISAHSSGIRGILIITGKSGVLNKEVPRWFEITPFVERILSIKKAKQHDGGNGALYVLLKAHHNILE